MGIGRHITTICLLRGGIMRALRAVAILTAACLALGLWGCGGDAPDEDAAVEEAALEQEAEPQEEAPKETPPRIDETVLIDEGGVRISAVSLQTESQLSAQGNSSLKLRLENSTEQNVSLNIRNVSVNGYMTPSVLVTSLDPGSSNELSLPLRHEDLVPNGISQIADIEFAVSATFTDGYGDPFQETKLSVYTSAMGSYVQQYDDGGEILYTDDTLTIISKGVRDETSGSGLHMVSLVVEVINNREDDIYLTPHTVMLNNEKYLPGSSITVCAGKRAIGAIDLRDSKGELEKHGASGITSLSIGFEAKAMPYDYNVAHTDIYQVQL